MSLAHMQEEFGKIDFSMIESLEKELSTNREKAMSFIKDPDGYMLSRMKGSYIPKGLHFHIKLDNALFPEDTQIPSNQITFSSKIKFSHDIEADVKAELQKLQAAKGPIKPLYCEGCGYCKIAIIEA